MNSDLETINTNTLIVAGYKNGTFEYLDFDSNSGGYPYASGHMRYRTSDMSKAVSWLGEAKSSYCGIPNPKVYEIFLKEVDIGAFVDEEKEVDSIISGLSETQLRMLKNKLR
jgi:hypothetical protein